MDWNSLLFIKMKIEKFSPIERASLRGEAFVLMRNLKFKVVRSDLVTHNKILANGRVVDSKFSGDVYFDEDLTGIINEDMVMIHDGSRYKLIMCELISSKNEFPANAPDIKFGIRFSIATLEPN